MNPHFDKLQTAPVEAINFEGLEPGSLSVLREDLIGAPVYGNKFRKLKYNVLEAQQLDKNSILTFGGAYSNHIAAVATIGNHFKIKTIGIIRGDELEKSWEQNPTLASAAKNGMQFEFISRAQYRLKETPEYLKAIDDKYDSPYIIPEGGTNALALKGCDEILSEQHNQFDIISVAVGTGGTLAGLANSCSEHQKVMGFSSLKGDFLNDDIKKWTDSNQWSLTDAYSFGGYGKISLELIAFINTFKQQTGITLDPVYNGKMMYGLIELFKRDYFLEKTRILAIHTGGLQGINGMNQKLSKKGWPLLSY